MPKLNAEMTMKAVMKVVSCGFMDVLCGSSINAINEHGFNRLLEDLNALERFSDQFNIQDLSSEISKPRKLCSLILSDKVKLLMVFHKNELFVRLCVKM